MDIEVLPPDVNESENDFAPRAGSEGAIRYGRAAVRNVGEGAVRRSSTPVAGKGAPSSFGDFCRKVEPSVLTKRVVESLIFAGAFDSFGYGARADRESRTRSRGRSSPNARRRPRVSSPLRRRLRASPRSTSPCSTARSSTSGRCSARRRRCSGSSSRITRSGVQTLAAQTTHGPGRPRASLGDGDPVTIGGIIGGRARKYTKRSEPYAQFRLRGLAGGRGWMAFPSLRGRARTDRARPHRARQRADRSARREMQIRATDPRAQPRRRVPEPAAPASRGRYLPAAACTPPSSRR